MGSGSRWRKVDSSSSRTRLRPPSDTPESPGGSGENILTGFAFCRLWLYFFVFEDQLDEDIPRSIIVIGHCGGAEERPQARHTWRDLRGQARAVHRHGGLHKRFRPREPRCGADSEHHGGGLPRFRRD